ncbi:MAG TPA: DUF2125 domain-containing protein [Rhodopila sp.]|nr:DUF2125 domain-containing protein [Rhodopila sp.]
MKVRRVAYGLIVLLVLLVAADVGYWKWAANRMRDGIRTWIADRTAEGWHVQTGKMSVGGWPVAVVAHLPNIVMAHDAAQGLGAFPAAVRLTSGAVDLLVPLYRPTTLTLSLQGEQSVQMGAAPPVLLAGDMLHVEVPLTSPANREVTLSGHGVRVQPAAKTWTVRIGTVDGQASLADAEAGAAAIDFTCSAKTIDLPTGDHAGGFRYPLGSSIADVTIDGTLNGPFPHGSPLVPPRAGASPAGALAGSPGSPPAPTRAGVLAASATAWRDGGGSLEVKEAVLDWGPLHMTSTATLALDDQLQPMGSGSAKVSGYQEALDRLAAAGVLTKSAATVAKAMLSLLAGTGTGDNPSEVEVPLTLQYRTLSMRQVPLVRLPELDWSSP